MKALRSALAERIINSGTKIPIENGATFEFEGKTYTVQLSSAKNLIKKNGNNGRFKKFLNVFFNQWLKWKNYFLKNRILIEEEIEEKNNRPNFIQEDNFRNVNLDKEIQDMIHDGWIEVVFKYIEEGYELKEEDCMNLLEKIWSAKYEYQKKIIEDIFLKKKLDVKYQAMFFYLLDIHSSQKNFEKEMLKKSKNDEFTQYVKHYWLSYLQKYLIDIKNSPYVYMNFHWENTLIDYPTVVLKQTSKQELTEIKNKLIKIKNSKDFISSKKIEKMLEIIQKNSYEIIESEIKQHIHFLKNGSFKKNDDHFFIHQIQQNKNDLSKETRKILKDLETLCENLINQNLKEEELFQLQNIAEKRIPEIIQKYLSIDREYRLELKNSRGQTAEEMMNDSLQELRENLKKIQKDVNENKFQELTVTHQYVKTMNR